MLYSKTLLLGLALATVCLLTGHSASARTKSKTKSFNIRGSGGTFKLGSVTCGMGTCSQYTGSQSGLNIPGIGNGATFSWSLTRGQTESTLPDGGDCFDFDGTGKIALGSSELDLSFAGTSGCFRSGSLGDFLFWKMVAVAQAGNGIFANAFGVADATAEFNMTSGDTEWELDGNYTN